MQRDRDMGILPPDSKIVHGKADQSIGIGSAPQRQVRKVEGIRNNETKYLPTDRENEMASGEIKVEMRGGRGRCEEPIPNKLDEGWTV